MNYTAVIELLQKDVGYTAYDFNKNQHLINSMIVKLHKNARLPLLVLNALSSKHCANGRRELTYTALMTCYVRNGSRAKSAR